MFITIAFIKLELLRYGDAFCQSFVTKFWAFLCCVFYFEFYKRFQFVRTFCLAEWWNDKLKCHVSLVNVQVQRPMVGSGFISSSRPSDDEDVQTRERSNTLQVKKTTPAALPSISGTMASNETKFWETSIWDNNQIFERVETTARSQVIASSEAPLSQPNRTYFSDTNHEQTNQSTRCDTDANTSYSRLNLAIQSALPPITSSISSQNDWSVPNSSNRFTSANATTDYNRSMSRKTSTPYGFIREDVFGDPCDKTRQLISNTKIVTPRTMQPSVQEPKERPKSLPWDKSSPSHDRITGWTDLAKLCCCCFFE